MGGAYLFRPPEHLDALEGNPGYHGEHLHLAGKELGPALCPSITATMPRKTSAAPGSCPRHHLCFCSASVPCKVAQSILEVGWQWHRPAFCYTKCSPEHRLKKTAHRECECLTGTPAAQPLDVNPREGGSKSLPSDAVRAQEKQRCVVTAHTTERSLKFQTSRTWI